MWRVMPSEQNKNDVFGSNIIVFISTSNCIFSAECAADDVSARMRGGLRGGHSSGAHFFFDHRMILRFAEKIAASNLACKSLNRRRDRWSRYCPQRAARRPSSPSSKAAANRATFEKSLRSPVQSQTSSILRHRRLRANWQRLRCKISIAICEATSPACAPPTPSATAKSPRELHL